MFSLHSTNPARDIIMHLSCCLPTGTGGTIVGFGQMPHGGAISFGQIPHHEDQIPHYGHRGFNITVFY